MKPLGRALMLQGTASGVGKSLLCTALCRLFYREGWRVAPFKAQNITDNVVVNADGNYIARSQALQALAAGVEPEPFMNPLLLRPGIDGGLQTIVMGRHQKGQRSLSFGGGYRQAAAVVADALAYLLERYDVVVLEGAGSPAEVNLMDRDVANMAAARKAGAAVVLVADIDRGGAFAAILGTQEILAEKSRWPLAGYILNKFRGQTAALEPALGWLHRRTGLPCFGVVPWLDDGVPPAGLARYGFVDNLFPGDGRQDSLPDYSLEQWFDQVAETVGEALDLSAVYEVAGLKKGKERGLDGGRGH